MAERRWSMVMGGALALGMASVSQPAAATAKVERVVSPGGIEAYLISEPSIPFLSMSIYFAGGAGLDPAGKDGLAYMVSGLLDEGAGDLDSQTFRTELEDLAIRLSFDARRDSFAGQLKTLTEHRARAFELLRLALTQPRFDAEPVERIRNQIQASLRRSAEDPDYVASLTWFENAFPGQPYGRPVLGTVESVGGLQVDDLRGFVSTRLAKDRLVVGVAGDVTAEELGPLLDLAFGDLPATGAPDVLEPTEPKGGLTVWEHRDVPQSQVVFGEAGLARDDPDYYAGYVANHILGGGGFTSRLTEEVREKRGLAYSVYSYLYPLELAPIWLGGLGTSNRSVDEALRLVRQEIERIAAGEITQEQLDDAKTYLTGSFPLRLTSNDRLADTLVGMQVDDLGIDYLDRRNAYIEAVTLADARRVAARLYDPEALLVVVVGGAHASAG
jgi:zinc protease